MSDDDASTDSTPGPIDAGSPNANPTGDDDRPPVACTIDEYLADLPHREAFVYQVNRGAFKKGDPKVAKLEEARDKAERLRAAALLYPRYLEAMQRAHRYDYDDMILWVLRAFEEHEALLRTYQEQYLYFLIDEYQDTNGAQNEIIHHLIDYWDNPNIFIVGDDDQSIYEFQGARLKNLTDFYDRYQADLSLVLLIDNYRSSQHILDHARALIDHNELRIINQLRELGLRKVLTARHDGWADSPLRPEIREYPNLAQEEAGLVRQFEELRDQGIPLEEVAVIYAKHRQAEGLVSLLEKKGIPYQTRRRLNILNLPLIINLRELLTYLETESRKPYQGEHLLFRILHFDFLEIAPADLARLSLYQAQQNADQRPYWRDLLREEVLLQSLGLQTTEALLRFGRLIEELLATLPNLGLTAFLERLINRSGLLAHTLAAPDRIGRIEVIRSFFDFVARETDRHPRLRLGRLLEMIHSLDANRLPLELNRTIVAAQGINLLTAHSAKGLEFRYVFLIDCVRDHWEPGNRGGNYRFSLPDTVTFSGEEDAQEARRRLFYVAMTRAREVLRLSYSRQDARGRERQRTRYLDEVILATGQQVRLEELPAALLAETQALQLTESEPPRLPAYNKEAVDHLLTGFALSISSLNHFLRCPLSFFYEKVLRIPVLFSEAAHYGIAMHNALERLFARMLTAPGHQFPSAPELVRLFELEMRDRRGQFSAREFERRLEMGRLHLAAYHQAHAAHWPTNVKVETTIRNAEIDGVPITGTIDRLEIIDPQTARILDYKTGSQNKAKVRPPTETNPLGGNYWRQLVFYKILYENSGRSTHRIVAGTISYLETDSRGNFPERTIEFTPDDVDILTKLIRTAYDRILAHDFYKGCGEPGCQWCNFVRHNVAIDSFAIPEIEELDD